MAVPMSDLGEQLDGWHALLLDEEDLDEALEVAMRVTKRVVARQSNGSAVEASVTVRPGDGSDAHTRAATDDVAWRLDKWQYEHGRGPCIASDAQSAICAVPDVGRDDTFPEFADVAAGAGIRGVASFPLLARDTSIGSLNLFAREAGEIDHEFVETGRQLAATFSPMLANFLTHQRTVALTDQLHEALEGRSIIERAKGLLMGRLAISADEAFGLLSTQSQHENRKVREVATGISDHQRARARAGPGVSRPSRASAVVLRRLGHRGRERPGRFPPEVVPDPFR